MSRRILVALIALLFVVPCFAGDHVSSVFFKKKAAGGGGPFTVIISNNTTGAYAGDYSGVSDAHIKLSAATTNYGTLATMETTNYQAGDHTSTVISFTGLSNIPSNATITSATLGLYMSNVDSSNRIITVKRLLRNWVVGQVTWSVYSAGNSWTTAGALSDGNDRSATITANPSIAASVGWKTWASEQLVTDIQNMVNGTNANYGWHFERTEGIDDAQYMVYDSSDAADGTRPYLSVTYTTP